MATGKMSASTNLYSGPGTTYDRDNLISNGTNVSVLWREGTYFYIEVNLSGLRQGYVPTGTVTGVTTGSVPTYTPSLALRYVHQDCISFMGPGTNYVPSQDNFSILDRIYYVEGRKQGDFALVEFTSRTTGNRKRAWVQHMKLGTAKPGVPYGRHIYTANRQINEKGEYWYISTPWNGAVGNNKGHLGIDIHRWGSSGMVTGINNEVYAIADGVIVETQDAGINPSTGKPKGNGNCVIIQHTTNTGKTYHSMYCHLASYYKKGSVLAGEAIGIMGTTGNSNNVHLHLAITQDNKGTGMYGYNYDSNGDTQYFNDQGKGYYDTHNIHGSSYMDTRYYSPTKYFTDGVSFINNN